MAGRGVVVTTKKKLERRISMVWHVGDLTKPPRLGRRKVGYEGCALSVSLDPEEWRRIARLGGKTIKLTKKGARFFLAIPGQALTTHWGEQNGFLQETTVWRVFMDDEDGVSWIDFIDRREAEDEAEDVDLVQAEVGWALGARGVDYWRACFGRAPRSNEHALAVDFSSLWYAESHGYDGVWWEEEYGEFSAPRGAIFRPEEWNTRIAP